MLYVVLHGQGEIALPVKCTSNKGNRAARHQLAHKNYAASPGIGRFSSHIETQIHFLKIAMQRDRKTEKASIEKQKSDDAHERLAVFIIDLGASGNERFNQGGVDNIIQHRQVTPVSGEKGLHVGFE